MELTPAGWFPVHASHTGSADLGFAALLGLAGVGSALLLGLGLAALARRRSRSYLLVTLALATLLARTAVAALSLTGSVDAVAHHWVEHGLDALMAALVVAAVYDARAVRRSSEGGGGGNEDGSARTVRGDGGRPAAEPEDYHRRDQP
ncbi:DUF7471 family protein [Halorussus litoreus]|uniref:DUF7471 family protein n=1 Tax=Halorussus litoreus TaxID=1710536 RepID=UPI0018E599EF|nr:hypothetical protein [Halorussus litoreus]